MWARIHLDLGWRDLLAGFSATVASREREAIERDIEAWWSPRGDTLVAFSVRSAFDLLLQALACPTGSEILFTAINIRRMVKIAKWHDLLPVPVDLNLDTMEPDLEALERAIGPQTRAIVVAPLFGSRFDLRPIAEIAHRRGLLLIEDCAQAFMGAGFRGNEEADVSLFSFGPLKFATALGGAVARVRDPALLARMREIQRGYPIQSSLAYFERLVKFGAFKLFLTRPVLGTADRYLRLRGVEDYEEVIGDSVRNIASLTTLDKLRKRCPPAMLTLLHRRLARFRIEDLEPRRAAGRLLLRELGDAVLCPGSKNAVHHFWAFPIVVDDPKRVMAALRGAGFDAAGLNRSGTVRAPKDRPKLEPVVARRGLEHLLVLPCYEGMPESELRRQAAVVRTAVGR